MSRPTIKPKTATPPKRAVIVCPVSMLRITVAVVDFYPAPAPHDRKRSHRSPQQ